VSRVLPNGDFKVCASYVVAPQKMKPKKLGLSTTYNPYGYPIFKGISKDSSLVFEEGSKLSNDFCTHLNATFVLPDTACLGEILIPKEVDTTSGLTHFWRIEKDDFSVPQTSYTANSTGWKKFYHRVDTKACYDTFGHYVYIVPFPKINFTDTLACGTPTMQLNFTSPLVSAYFLDNKATNSNITLTKSGTYKIKLQQGICSLEKEIKVKIVDFPKPILAPDSVYCFGTAFVAKFNKDFENILWDKKTFRDSVLVRDDKKHFYQATYSKDKDCVVKGDLQVKNKKCGDLPDIVYIPNVFSPNGDNTNEVFQAYAPFNIEMLGLQIFDRWGTLVYETFKTPFQWNGEYEGKPAPQSVYVYRINYHDLRSDKIIVKRGDVMLMR
jgi:gliding motility-associated-like protein